jgi:hypothetical protein
LGYSGAFFPSRMVENSGLLQTPDLSPGKRIGLVDSHIVVGEWSEKKKRTCRAGLARTTTTVRQVRKYHKQIDSTIGRLNKFDTMPSATSATPLTATYASCSLLHSLELPESAGRAYPSEFLLGNFSGHYLVELFMLPSRFWNLRQETRVSCIPTRNSFHSDIFGYEQACGDDCQATCPLLATYLGNLI